MIHRLVVFGATGDLTARYLLPALTALRGDPASLAAVIGTDEPVAAYLALPPAVFPAAVTGLHEAGLPAGSRIVLEKPFGEDLDSAIALNKLLTDVLPEQAIFRVDHFLAMTTVQNLLGTRLANRVLEPLWNSAHIAEVEIIWDESLALEGRAGYYDGVGALKDMLQNHLLQLLCLVAFRPVPHLPFGFVGDAAPNQLSFGLDPEDLRLELTGIGAQAKSLAPLTMTGRLESPDLPGYGQLLHAVLTGDAALSIRGDEAEQSWRVVAPILAAWAKDLVPLDEYAAGSDGPARQQPARQP